MIAVFLKAYWKLLAVLLAVAGALWLTHHLGYSSGHADADTGWQTKWSQRDRDDAASRLEFTQEQRRREQQRQADIDRIQREADEENRKASAARAAAQRAADRLQVGIVSAIAQLQQRRSDDTGVAAGGKAGSSTGDLLAQLYREIDGTAGELAAEADRRGRVAMTCEKAYDAIRNTPSIKLKKQSLLSADGMPDGMN